MLNFLNLLGLTTAQNTITKFRNLQLSSNVRLILLALALTYFVESHSLPTITVSRGAALLPKEITHSRITLVLAHLTFLVSWTYPPPNMLQSDIFVPNHHPIYYNQVKKLTSTMQCETRLPSLAEYQM